VKNGTVNPTTHFLPAALALALGASTLLGAVAGTAHDFSGAGWSRGEICLPCHASHNSPTAKYSWNRAVSDDAAFLTRDGAVLGIESLMCLGCHDGQTAMDSFGGGQGTVTLTGDAVVGRDLRNEHPVGVPYPTAADNRYKPSTTVRDDLALFNGKVECQSCHDPHDNRHGNFLRVDRRSLCQTCHDL